MDIPRITYSELKRRKKLQYGYKVPPFCDEVIASIDPLSEDSESMEIVVRLDDDVDPFFVSRNSEDDSESDVDCVDDDGEHVRNIFDVIDDM